MIGDRRAGAERTGSWSVGGELRMIIVAVELSLAVLEQDWRMIIDEYVESVWLRLEEEKSSILRRLELGRLKVNCCRGLL